MGKVKLWKRKMQIFVNTLDGSIIPVDVTGESTVSDVKNEIIMAANLDYASQKLILGGKLLNDSTTMAELEIQDNCTIDLAVALQGGAGTKSQMDPVIIEMSKKYNHDKKICRKCYATLPPRAKKCRKRACGHWPDIRPRKVIKQK